MIRRWLVPPARSGRASAGLLILRLLCGAAFMVHGFGKIQAPFGWMGPDSSMPGFFQALAALSGFGGGLACTMAVAVYFHGVVLRHTFFAQSAAGSCEPAAVYLCVALLLLLAGPGALLLDRVVFRLKS